MQRKKLAYISFILFLCLILVIVFHKPAGNEIYDYNTENNKYNKLFKMEAQPDKGFYWPYLLYIPDNVKETSGSVNFLVIPNNTSLVTDNDRLQEQETIEELKMTLPQIYQNKKMDYILLQPVFPRYRNKFGSDSIQGAHSLGRSILLFESDKKYIAVKIRRQGTKLSKHHKLIYDLDTLFVVQDNLIYNCVAADFNPEQAFATGNQFTMTLFLEGGWDYSRPFNLIENYQGKGALLFQDVFKDSTGQIKNNKFKTDKSNFEVISLSEVKKDTIKVWNNQGEQIILNQAKKIERIDLQLLAMVEQARKLITEDLNLDVKQKLTMAGFSAAGDFVDRFSVLHPEQVSSVFLGGCNVMLPLAEWQGENLPYPIGTYDYKKITGRKFDIDKFAEINRLIIRGEQDKLGWITAGGEKKTTEDYNRDKLLPLFKQRKDKVPVTTDGKISEVEEEEIRYRIFDYQVSVKERFIMTKQLYHELGLNNHQFKLYKDTGHELTKEIQQDMLEFFVGRDNQ